MRVRMAHQHTIFRKVKRFLSTSSTRFHNLKALLTLTTQAA